MLLPSPPPPPPLPRPPGRLPAVLASAASFLSFKEEGERVAVAQRLPPLRWAAAAAMSTGAVARLSPPPPPPRAPLAPPLAVAAFKGVAASRGWWVLVVCVAFLERQARRRPRVAPRHK